MGFKMVKKPTSSLCIEKIELEPNIIGKLLTCQGIFSKKIPNVNGLIPQYSQMILVSGYLALTALKILFFYHKINVQYQVAGSQTKWKV